MTDLRQADVLIIGQGVAGSALTLELLRRGRSVIVVDSGLPSSTSVAAGVYNPMVLKRLNKAWMADETLSEGRSFYTLLEKAYNTRFFYSLSVIKIFSGPDDKAAWEKKREEFLAHPPCYLNAPVDDTSVGNVPAPFGYATVEGSGWIDTVEFLGAVRNDFTERGILQEGHFDPSEVNWHSDGGTWKNIRFGKLVMCTGSYAVNDGLFPSAIFSPVKGDVLDLEWEGGFDDGIINKGIFILPLGGSQVKVGSTYNWSDLTFLPNEAGKADLLKKFEALTKSSSYRVTAHRAGVRPATRDRRPLMGNHPDNPNLFIFNGLGSRGMMLAPFLAARLADHLVFGKAFASEADVRRFMQN